MNLCSCTWKNFLKQLNLKSMKINEIPCKNKTKSFLKNTFNLLCSGWTVPGLFYCCICTFNRELFNKTFVGSIIHYKSNENELISTKWIANSDYFKVFQIVSHDRKVEKHIATSFHACQKGERERVIHSLVLENSMEHMA